jgi:hypothetical protein
MLAETLFSLGPDERVFILCRYNYNRDIIIVPKIAILSHFIPNCDFPIYHLFHEDFFHNYKIQCDNLMEIYLIQASHFNQKTLYYELYPNNGKSFKFFYQFDKIPRIKHILVDKYFSSPLSIDSIIRQIYENIIEETIASEMGLSLEKISQLSQQPDKELKTKILLCYNRKSEEEKNKIHDIVIELLTKDPKHTQHMLALKLVQENLNIKYETVMQDIKIKSNYTTTFNKVI